MGKTIKSNVRKLQHPMISKFKQKQEEKEIVFQEKQCLHAISDFLANIGDIQGILLNHVKNVANKYKQSDHITEEVLEKFIISVGDDSTDTEEFLEVEFLDTDFEYDD